MSKQVCFIFVKMYVRRKINASGSTSVQVVQKSSGRIKILKTIGSSKIAIDIEELCQRAQVEMRILQRSSELPFHQNMEQQYVADFKSSIQQLQLVGPELLLGKLFDEIGFNSIADELFRHLVITRLVYPVSKLKTVDYLFKYQGIQLSVYSIYRYLDKLQKHQIEQVKSISLQHTLQLLGNQMSIVFYDVTTLYFESKEEDEFKRMGFSKDGKHQQPQIVLGLLVSQGGYPLDYDVFEGDKYEGDTLIPIIEHFVSKHQVKQLIVVADAGLLSQKNMALLTEKQYQYILGARIKNENEAITKQVLALPLQDGQCASINREDGTKLIVSYTKARAINDYKNRQRGFEKLEKKIKSGKLTKQHINNKGYNKYLKIGGEASISIDKEKYNDDKKWDGLKGYRTNTSLTKEEVIEQYHQLWQIEKAFRISKHDLQIRPMYHQLKRRIEAHICIAFAACKIYKELERQLKEKKTGQSPEQAINILKTIQMVQFTTPYSNKIYEELILNTAEQKVLATHFNLHL
jgi:transposase